LLLDRKVRKFATIEKSSKVEVDSQDGTRSVVEEGGGEGGRGGVLWAGRENREQGRNTEVWTSPSRDGASLFFVVLKEVTAHTWRRRRGEEV
jgi:hypothetical protein